MPVVEPEGFHAFNLIPFQINPHYTDAHPQGHAGETREDRLMEYLTANQESTVLGLREGCMLRIEGPEMRLIGDRPVRVFRYGAPPLEQDLSHDFSQYLKHQ
jgi:dipeptidase E